MVDFRPLLRRVENFTNTNNVYSYDMFNTEISILSSHYMQGFMGVVSETSKSTTTVTRYPVETVQQIQSDHIHINPRSLNFSVIVSGSHYFTPNQAFSSIRNLQESRQPISIITNLHSFSNMIVTSLEGSNDPKSNQSVLNIKAEEVLVLGRNGRNRGVENNNPAVEHYSKTTKSGRVNHIETGCYTGSGGNWICQ